MGKFWQKNTLEPKFEGLGGAEMPTRRVYGSSALQKCFLLAGALQLSRPILLAFEG
jgi:hypothetical protein